MGIHFALLVALPNSGELSMRAKFFDYGVISIRLTRPFAGSWSDFAAFTRHLRNDASLEQIARDALQQMLTANAAALDDPQARPDVVVTDIMMPKLSGLGVLDAIRRAQLHFPVILMTVLADESVYVVAKRLGAVGVLRKPFDIDDLRTAVVNACCEHPKRPAPRA